MLIKLNRWLATRFEDGSAPDPRVCRREIDLGTLPGKRIGNTYYVDTEKEQRASGDRKLDELLTH